MYVQYLSLCGENFLSNIKFLSTSWANQIEKTHSWKACRFFLKSKKNFFVSNSVLSGIFVESNENCFAFFSISFTSIACLVKTVQQNITKLLSIFKNKMTKRLKKKTSLDFFGGKPMATTINFIFGHLLASILSNTITSTQAAKSINFANLRL